jgi:hypothetical protein
VTTFKLDGESTESSIVNLLPVLNEYHGLQEDWVRALCWKRAACR